MADYNYSDTDITFTGTGTPDILNFNNDAGGSFDWRNFNLVQFEDDDLLIHGNNGYTATVSNHFVNDTARMETLTFDDGFTVDLTASNLYTTKIDEFGNILAVYGAASDDSIFAGVGRDLYANALQTGKLAGTQASGGDGNDIIIANYAGSVSGGNGNDTFYTRSLINFGDAGNDTFHFSTVDLSAFQPGTEVGAGGGSGDDVFYGTYLEEAAWGDDDNDTFYGYAGNDRFYGGDGDDIGYGGDGDDYLIGCIPSAQVGQLVPDC